MKVKAMKAPAATAAEQLDLRPGQSLELLQELHILTREGRINQDSRRKLKQVYHLFQFIEPLLQELSKDGHAPLWPTTARASRIWASSCTTCISKHWGAAIFTALNGALIWWTSHAHWRRSWALSGCRF